MTRKKDAVYENLKRLESKNARAAILQKISADFNLRFPIMAEVYYKQMVHYFQEHADIL